MQKATISSSLNIVRTFEATVTWLSNNTYNNNNNLLKNRQLQDVYIPTRK